MTYRVFRIGGNDRHIQWGATSDYTLLQYILAPRMIATVHPKTGDTEWCFYGRTPFEALERLKRYQRRAKA